MLVVYADNFDHALLAWARTARARGQPVVLQNPRFFADPLPDATHVWCRPMHTAVQAAYTAVGVSVEMVGDDDVRDVPAGAAEVSAVPASVDSPPSAAPDPQTDATGRYQLQHRGFGWYDVIDTHTGTQLNDRGMKHAEAAAWLTELTDE